MKPNFEVLMMEEVIEFLNSLEKKARHKIHFNIKKAQFTNDTDLFKKLKGSNIWEFRTKYSGIQYRLLAFWDPELQSIVICTHGFIKKTQKTPKNEIEKAETIRKNYLNTP